MEKLLGAMMSGLIASLVFQAMIRLGRRAGKRINEDCVRLVQVCWVGFVFFCMVVYTLLKLIK